MQTHNRYMNIIAIVIAAACLSLATACSADATPTHEVTAVPTQKATDTPTAEFPDQLGICTTESPELTSRLNTMEEEYLEHLDNQSRAAGVLYEHRALFWRQPNVHDVSESFLRDENGEWTNQWGITVWVTEKVDQNTLPAEGRIPDLLDDVRIQITQAAPPSEVPVSSCDYSMCRANSQEGETTMNTTNPNTPERRHEVRLKYDPLFWRQPNVWAVGEGFLADEHGGWLDTKGINIRVTRKVDQSTLPPEDRIPDCLEGIPVKITEEAPPVIETHEDPNKEEANDSN